jgi:hypothetical protein
MKTFFATIVIPVKCDGKDRLIGLRTDDFASPETARDYSKVLIYSGIAVAYRVCQRLDNGSVHNHEYAHYLGAEHKNLDWVDNVIRLQTDVCI